MKFLKNLFNKNKKKKNYNNITVLTFRDNYSTLSEIYRGKSYIIEADTGTIFLDLININVFWEKYIVNHKKYLNKNDQSFVTIRIIDSKNNNYIFKETIKEKTKLNSASLIALSDSKKFTHFENGLIEIGFWDFNNKTFEPVWSAKYIL